MIPAVLLLVLGGLCVYFGSHNYLLRVLGVAAIMVSVYLVRISRVRSHPGLREAGQPGMELKTTRGPGRLLWIVSLAFLPLLGVSIFLLHIDAANGGHAAWPADLFAGVALACAAVWGCLIAKIFGSAGGKNSHN